MPKKAQMTELAQVYLEYILAYHAEHGAVPSTAALAEHFGCSRQNVYKQEDRLVALGHLRRIPDPSRARRHSLPKH